MEIQENEYVRTVQGTIAKIEDLEFDIRVRFTTGLPMYRKVTKTNINTDSVEFEVIKKHSFNIIDLIEVGDIVHVGDVLYEDKVCIWTEEYLEQIKKDIENGLSFKSIVTKEQFESIKYEV